MREFLDTLDWQRSPWFQWLPWYASSQESLYPVDLSPADISMSNFEWTNHYAGWLWWQIRWET